MNWSDYSEQLVGLIGIHNISAKLDSEVVYAFSCISEAAAKQAIDFLVVGATARDYLLELGCALSLDPERLGELRAE